MMTRSYRPYERELNAAGDRRESARRRSGEAGDAGHEDRRIAELARGPLSSPEHPLRAEIGRNTYGGFYACLRGWGYPDVRELPDFAEQPRAAEDALDALVAQGYALQDPKHLIDLYDLFDEPTSQYEDSLDATELPGGYIGRGTDSVQRMIDLMDAGAMGEIECAYLRTVEPEI